MLFLMQNWMWIALLLISGGMLLWPKLQNGMTGAGGRGVSPTQAVRLINKDKAVLIDVRDAQEYATSHAKGARNVPLEQLQQELAQTVKNTKTPIVFICATDARANRAATQAKKQGYEAPHVLRGGLKAWQDAALPTATGKKA